MPIITKHTEVEMIGSIWKYGIHTYQSKKTGKVYMYIDSLNDVLWFLKRISTQEMNTTFSIRSRNQGIGKIAKFPYHANVILNIECNSLSSEVEFQVHGHSTKELDVSVLNQSILYGGKGIMVSLPYHEFVLFMEELSQLTDDGIISYEWKKGE